MNTHLPKHKNLECKNTCEAPGYHPLSPTPTPMLQHYSDFDIYHPHAFCFALTILTTTYYYVWFYYTLNIALFF